jgi:hypothetical protein
LPCPVLISLQVCSVLTVRSLLLWANVGMHALHFHARRPLFGALCLAENCIGPSAYRPDDILTMHSG